MSKRNKNFHAIKFSTKHGEQMEIAGTKYYGRNPEYHRLPNGQFMKVAKGVPFVKDAAQAYE